MQQGVVLKNYGGFYYLQDQTGTIYECQLRGKIRTRIITGDRVTFTSLSEDRGIIENVLPRESELYRPKIANVDTVLVVMAYDCPAPSLILLDRLLILICFNRMEPIIVMNKSDLKAVPAAETINTYYQNIGFTVLRTSTVTGTGLDVLPSLLHNKVTVLAGPSGSGKSSLLNALIRSLAIKTQEISRRINRGRHTTRHVELYPLDTGGWIADAPGFGNLDLPAVEPVNLTDYFIEFVPFRENCRFADCIHRNEKECGIKQAVAEGFIAGFRYQNYLTLLDELTDKERCY